MKTIKQVSESINISKVSVYKAIKRDEMKPFIFKDKDNVTLINEDGEKLLISLFNREKAETINDIADTILTDSKEVNKPVNEEERLVISILQEELKQKNEEINSLLNIITNQQSITMNQQKLQVTQYLTDKNIMDGGEPLDQTNAEPPKGFFKKLFRKK